MHHARAAQRREGRRPANALSKRGAVLPRTTGFCIEHERQYPTSRLPPLRCRRCSSAADNRRHGPPDPTYDPAVSNKPGSLLDRPYASRRLIVVVPDEVAQAEQEIAGDGADASVRDSRLKRALASVETVTLSTGILGVGVEIARAASDARSDGLDVLSVGRSEAATLRLPPGHPRDKVLYVGHPAVPDIYYGAAHFHRLTFEHKFAEAVRLLMALGATNLRVEHVRGWSHDFAVNLSVALPSQPVEVGATAERQQSASRSALFTAELPGSNEPFLPSDLVWLPHEPAWQQIAEGRTQYGLLDFALALAYEDDYGVNAGLKLGIAKYGLDLGGKFEDHQSTLWRISGTFRTAS